jgi:alpha-N-arabinofuranosidase
MSADEYVREASRWAKAIRRLDPSVKLVSCGLNGWDEWDRIVVEGMASLVDLHSLHIYTGSKDYWDNVLTPHQVERAVSYTSRCISRAVYTQRLRRAPRIAYDEWNVWYRTHDGTLEERYSFPDALAVATYLNIFVRNCDWVRMANLAQMVNAIAPIVTTKTAAFVQPIYYPFLLHANAALDEAIDVYVSSPSVEGPEATDRWQHRIADLGPFLTIDASATSDAGRSKLAVTIVNRDPGSADSVEVRLRDSVFAGEARVTTLTAGPSPASPLAPDIEGVKVEEGSENGEGGTIVVTVPPASFTVIESAIVGAR